MRNSIELKFSSIQTFCDPPPTVFSSPFFYIHVIIMLKVTVTIIIVIIFIIFIIILFIFTPAVIITSVITCTFLELQSLKQNKT